MEYLELLRVAPHHLKAAMVIGFNTGMRKGEILGLKWNNLEPERQGVWVAATDTKEEREKYVPFNHHVVETLKSVYEKQKEDREKRGYKKNGYVLNFVGKPISQKDALKHSLATACNAVNILYGAKTPKGIIFHDFRRTFKTNMARAGIDKAIRDTILGHNLPGMDDHYIKLNKNALHDAMEKFTEWLDNRLSKAKIQLESEKK